MKRVFLGYSSSQQGYKCRCPSEKRRFVRVDVTFRSLNQLTDLSLLFAELHHLHSVKDGQVREQAASHTQGDSVGTNTDDDVQVQVQPIVGQFQFVLSR